RSTPIMYVNADLLDAANLGMPESWDELRHAANALTQRRAADTVWGFECPVSWWFWVALVGAAGGTLVDEAGRVTVGGDAGVHALRRGKCELSREGGGPAPRRSARRADGRHVFRHSEERSRTRETRGLGFFALDGPSPADDRMVDEHRVFAGDANGRRRAPG